MMIHQRDNGRRVLGFKVFAGFGVAGNLDNIFISSGESFVSCSAIVMFNNQSHIGGLFHFGAGQYGVQQPALRAMCEYINPTGILVCPAQGGINDDASAMSIRDMNLLLTGLGAMAPSANIIQGDPVAALTVGMFNGEIYVDSSQGSLHSRSVYNVNNPHEHEIEECRIFH